MDRDGVQTQLIFGPIFQISTEDPVLRAACYQVFNDWLLDFCTAAPDRLIGVPQAGVVVAADLQHVFGGVRVPAPAVVERADRRLDLLARVDPDRHVDPHRAPEQANTEAQWQPGAIELQAEEASACYGI